MKWQAFLWKIQKKHIRETQGSAAIEFAFLFPVFFLTFMAVFELGAIMFVQTTLERAVLNVARFGRTGDEVPSQTREDTAQALIKAATLNYLFLDPAKLVLTVTSYDNFADIPTSSTAPSTGVKDFGSSRKPVLYTLNYPWNFWTPLLGQFLSNTPSSTIYLTATSIIQNEPF